MITFLADEFGVQAEAAALAQMSTTLGQRFGFFHQNFAWILPPHSTVLTRLRHLAIAHAPAAVHRKHRARDEAGLIAAKEDRGIGAVLRLPRPGLERLLDSEKRRDARLMNRPMRHRSVDKTGGDDIYSDAVGR